MNNLTHYRCAILKHIVVHVCLYRKASWTHKLDVLGLKLAVELCWLEERGHGMEIGRVGVCRRYCAGIR